MDPEFIKTDPVYQLVKNNQTLIHKKGETLYAKIPNWKVKKFIPCKPMVISGPYNPESPGGTFGNSFGVSVSNYPATSIGREGDPICDCYRVNTYQNALITVLCDGCGWGEKSKQAALRVSTNVTKHLSLSIPNFKNTKEVAQQLVHAFAIANYSISYDVKDPFSAGTTTTIAGVCMETAEPQDPSIPKWVYVFITIGDCKVFKYDAQKRECCDVTVGNRMNVDDPRDPGGRLGPYKGKGDPDLRNLDLLYCGCNDGDILILVSDGVHDNFDPMHIGKQPKDIGITDYDNWDDIPDEIATVKKTEFMNKCFTDLIHEQERSTMLSSFGPQKDIVVTPALITKKAIRYCREITGGSRQWMEQNPGALVHDYVKFPGKLDHTTCVCSQVGIYIPGKDDIPANSLDTMRWPFL